MKRFTWGKIVFMSFLCVAVAQADIKMSGHAEAGTMYRTNSGGSSGFDFLVDHVVMHVDASVSDKTSFHVSKGLAYATTNSFTAGGVTATPGYWNTRGGITTPAASALVFNINHAYLQHKCASFLTTQIGVTKTPFGMESQWERYDYAHYAYSRATTAAATNGWNYDLGIVFNFEGDNVPGKFELALQDGDTASNTTRARPDTPAVAARYQIKLDAGNMSFTPVASVYANSFGNSGPHDFGFSGGMMFEMGMFMLNAEFQQVGAAPTVGGVIARTRSIWFQPSVDFGVAKLTGMVDLGRVAGVNDTNIGIGISKEYDDHRVRLLWSYNNLSGNLGGKVNDFRLLFGTKF